MRQKKRWLGGRWYVPGYALTQRRLTSPMVERPAELGFLDAVSKALMSKIIFSAEGNNNSYCSFK